MRRCPDTDIDPIFPSTIHYSIACENSRPSSLPAEWRFAKRHSAGSEEGRLFSQANYSSERKKVHSRPNLVITKQSQIKQRILTQKEKKNQAEFKI